MEVLVFAIVLTLLYLVCGAYHRLFLSPVAQFPGPRLAALTFWYEFWYDVVKRGKYTWKIRELHEKYGPVVRINPYELHISDATFYNNLYVGPSVRKTNKWPWSARMFGTTFAAVGTADHDVHHMRRAALNPFFSRQNMVALQPDISRHVDKLLSRLQEHRGTGRPVNLVDAFTALTADIIGSLAFGQEYGFLDKEQFHPEWHVFMMELSRSTHLMKQFPWLYQLLEVVPRRMVSWVHPLTRRLFALQDDIVEAIDHAKQSQSAETTMKQKSSDGPGQEDHKMRRTTLLSALLSTSHLPDAEKLTPRLLDEALTLLGAGTVTTAWTLSVTCFHVLSNAHVLERLRSELKSLPKSEASNLRPSYTDLAKLPYLNAVIDEGLRLSHGTAHRLPRILPDSSLRFGDWDIPPGTPVSMTQMDVHLDPNIFPCSDSFLPERWLPEGGSEEERRERRKYLAPFGKGSRACVGRELAFVEIVLGIVAIFGDGIGFDGEEGNEGLEMELYETTERDVQVEMDWFNPVPYEGSKGVRVLVR
ncbi:cytochrome P450 [Lophiostoma macrostomum CBS 122681]|uniref:Cytochrome P450 n=1 Tax=Lophiostoma macrostomum CBS 122681 TaxID=1314788 RepID=A0A6A6T9W5_9PLEO|nr:cytochrome P450 [Lophiostoma macrostomum CBS 122681]